MVETPLRELRTMKVRRRRSDALGAAAFVLIVAWVYFDASDFNVYSFTLVGIFGLVAVSQEWLTGRAGQVSMGAAAIMASGAYAMELVHDQSWAVFPVPLLVAGAAGAAIGGVVGVAGLRFTGLYLLLATLALQVMVGEMGRRYQGVRYEGGFVVAPPKVAGIDFASSHAYFLLVATCLALVMLILRGIYRSPVGRGWEAMRQNEIAATALGVHAARWKLVAFIGSSSITAMAGALYGYLNYIISYSSFTLELSVTLLLMVFIGGRGTLCGPLLGAVTIVFFPVMVSRLTRAAPSSGLTDWILTNEAHLASAAYGLMLMLVLLFERDGLFGLARRVVSFVARLAARAARPVRRKAAESNG